jgi:type IV secretion system protein VirB5
MLKRNRSLSPPPATDAPPRRADNPFVAARREWDDRWDRLAASRRNWQVFAALLLLLDISLAAALFYMGSKSRITPYVVEVDRHGHAVAFGPAERLKDPGERILRYELATFVDDLRTVHAPGGEAAQRQGLARLHAHLRQPAASRVAEWFARNNPFEPGHGAVSVEVTSVLRLEEDLWQIEWSETHYARDGSPLRTEPWQAVVSILIDPPEDSEKILSNPLGIFVTHLDWTHVPGPKEKN